jgi:hypothetical protein
MGRVGAIVNHLHNAHGGGREGFFGFFDAIEDQDVADALLDAAAGWLRAQGMSSMLGPASPSHNYEYGLLVEGFDRPHRFLLAHNPPYYDRLLAGWGLVKVRDLYAFSIDLRDADLARRVQRDGARVLALWKERFPDVRVRSANFRRFSDEVRIAVDLVNRSLRENWGYSPMSEGEMKEMAQTLRFLVDPKLLLLVERAGEPVGVGLAIPDLNLLIRRLRLRWGWLEPVELLARFKRTRVRAARTVALGMVQDRALPGAGAVLMYEMYRRLVGRGIFELDASWILEDNAQMLLPLHRFGLQPDRTYRLYEKPLVD